jgi:nicotinamidase/pyrazinamidase
VNLPPVNTVTDALVVVDLQPDFMDGGALPVQGGGELLDAIPAILPLFSTVVATQDWHPSGHASFASTHGAQPYSTKTIHGKEHTLWPDHCVQGSLGAQLPHWLRDRADLILRKGAAPLVHS